MSDVQTPIGLPARELPKTADQVADEIRALRDRKRFDGGVKVNGLWFLSTNQAVIEYTTLLTIAQSMNAPDGYVLRERWRTMEKGSTVDMTPALARQILAAGLQQVCAIDDVAQAHIAAVYACDDPTTYDYAGGWPETFGG